MEILWDVFVLWVSFNVLVWFFPEVFAVRKDDLKSFMSFLKLQGIITIIIIVYIAVYIALVANGVI